MDSADALPRLVYNGIKTPDGTVLQSNHRHDYLTYEDTVSGETYMVDGGLDYLRRSVNKVPFEEQSLHEKDSFALIRDRVTWGRARKDGKGHDYIKLCDLETDHIQNILKLDYLSSIRRSLMLRELEYRNNEHMQA